MATVWITYAWNDNNDSDVDFIAQELERIGLSVKLDRWNVEAGKRLWQQIENFITNPNESDAWILVATQNSLGSEACKEEYFYALDRALHQRGSTFPIISLFTSTVDDNLIPAGIRVRLYVSITDPDWKERIKATAEGIPLSIEHPQVLPYTLKIYQPKPNSRRYTIEVRPRAGVWAPFVAAIPEAEKDVLDADIIWGPKDGPPRQVIMNKPIPDKFPSDDGKWWMMAALNEASPTQSYYIGCDGLPSQILFGIYKSGGEPLTLYHHRFTPDS